jgi:exopolyphosphatase/pppGpp-phosphohydrolase
MRALVRVARTGAIGSRKEHALRAVRKVLDEARRHGYDQLLARHRAVRAASDSTAFARDAEAVPRVPCTSLASEVERFSRRSQPSRLAQGMALVDLGGSSTEVVAARERGMLRSAKLGLGSGVLAAQLQIRLGLGRARVRSG